MERIEATYRIVTPMFIGDANKEATCIRPPSFKGVLRFWWRALNWGSFYKQENGNETEALKALHEEEVRLFGGSAEKGGQGCFLLSIQRGELSGQKVGNLHPNLKPSKQVKNQYEKMRTDPNDMASARYLGYGLIVPFTTKDGDTKKIKSHAGQLDRTCLDEDQCFTVLFLFRDKVDDSILSALKAIGLLGSMGSRSRHGFGSIALERIVCGNEETWTSPKNQEQYQTKVKKLFGCFSNIPQPPYSAFSADSRVDWLLADDSPYKVLDQFGMKMLDYRSWGRTAGDGTRRPLPSGKKSEERFEDDHHWFRKNNWRLNHPDFHPRRVMFGLPHNYGQSSNSHVTAEKHDRRSSPLFFHVHPVGKNIFAGIAIYLPSMFLPAGEKTDAGGSNVTAKTNDWNVITDFLDGKVGNPATKEDRFPKPGKKAVLP